MRFKIGQQIVCISTINEWRSDKRVTTNGPKFNEVYTVAGYNSRYDWGVLLVEYPSESNGYDEQYFEPLIDDSVLEKELASIPELLSNQLTFHPGAGGYKQKEG